MAGEEDRRTRWHLSWAVPPIISCLSHLHMYSIISGVQYVRVCGCLPALRKHCSKLLKHGLFLSIKITARVTNIMIYNNNLYDYKQYRWMCYITVSPCMQKWANNDIINIVKLITFIFQSALLYFAANSSKNLLHNHCVFVHRHGHTHTHIYTHGLPGMTQIGSSKNRNAFQKHSKV